MSTGRCWRLRLRGRSNPNQIFPRLEEQIWELLAVDERTPAQEAYFTLLSGLVERWESEHVVVRAVHGVELVKALLVERQLRQKDLVPVFGTESIVSEVLS